MKRILKFQVPVDDQAHRLMLPDGAWIVHVDVQGAAIDVVTFWALVETGQPEVPRAFHVYPTGAPVTSDCDYVGTALAAAGGLVWHLFEVPA